MILVIPMAGRGSRFADKGVATPKPLIEVAGHPMVRWALRSYEGHPFSKVIFIALREHEKAFGLTSMLRGIIPHPVEVLLIDEVTEGQLCTVLVAKDLINSSEDVLIGCSDTWVQSNIFEDIRNLPKESHGLISVADLPGDRWSFARVDAKNRVVEVAEKRRISSHASTGLYYFCHGDELVEQGEAMVNAREKSAGEFYVIPVYQKFIDKGWHVGISVSTQVWDMGTPEAKATFESHYKNVQTF